MSNLGYFALGLGLLVVYLVAMGAVLFGAAGTLAVPMFWAYLTLFAVLCVGASAAVYLLSPDLVKERVRPGAGEQDRVTVRALNLLMFAQWLLAGLDVGRLHWSATVPFPLQVLGLIGFAMGLALTTWAMLVNRFFSSAVRLQPDRGQHVVTAGPYRVVRHPGYSGGQLLLLSIGLALGYRIAMAATLLIVPFDSPLRQGHEQHYGGGPGMAAACSCPADDQ
jgi:protein-S-isoprenylcysteine O-methyltransferase Ste14